MTCTPLSGRVSKGHPARIPLRCFRLNESRPAGRITDRLLQEIRSGSLCIADLTGGKPNVMWEVGYAMALGKPTIIITQDKGEMPFDIRDMETLQYDRRHLNETLGNPLKRAVIRCGVFDTVSQPSEQQVGPRSSEPNAATGAAAAGST